MGQKPCTLHHQASCCILKWQHSPWYGLYQLSRTSIAPYYTLLINNLQYLLKNFQPTVQQARKPDFFNCMYFDFFCWQNFVSARDIVIRDPGTIKVVTMYVINTDVMLGAYYAYADVLFRHSSFLDTNTAACGEHHYYSLQHFSILHVLYHLSK